METTQKLMDRTQKLRGVKEATQGSIGTMNKLKLQREAATLAGLLPARKLAMDVLNDDDVRDAAREVFNWVLQLRHELSGTDDRLRRLATDKKLQEEIAALVRSAAKALDAGTAVGKRRVRHRALKATLVLAAAAGVLVLVRQLSSEADGDFTSQL